MGFVVNYPSWNQASVVTSGTTSSTAGTSFTPQVIAIFDRTGRVAIGTSSITNILTIQQTSPTDPIADAWTIYSSKRWKNNIKPIEGALDKVKQLRGVTFNWKSNGEHDIGMIAEEVGKVLPELVEYEENGVDAKSLDYARLAALLIEAVKEQQKEIDGLKNQLSAEQSGR
jgi:hypothetical protein